MKRWFYKKGMKAALAALQAAAAGLLCYCLLNIAFWMDGADSIWDVAGSFEQSGLFFRTVESTVKNKIESQQNSELFESGGEFDPDKEIDIQSYGRGNVTLKDLNTTYRLGDLLEFGQNGGSRRLLEAVRQAVTEEGGSGVTAGEALDARSGELETIRPVTGISLSECSRWYSDSAGFVLRIYQALGQVSDDIAARYTEYGTQQEQSWSKYAPSNLRYCVENSATGELYTNLEADSYAEASAKLREEEGFVCLYEGERSFNIMVANPDNVLNQEAADWFTMNRFVNTNEKVLLAFNPQWPVSDELRRYAEFFARRNDFLLVFGCLGCAAALVLVCGFAVTVKTAGFSSPSDPVRLNRLDGVPTELAAGLYTIFAVVLLLILVHLAPEKGDLFGTDRGPVSLLVCGGYLVFLSGAAGFARRLRAGTLWTNSICHMLLHSWKRVTSARIMSGQFFVMYLCILALNFLFLVFFGPVGIFLALVLDAGFLLYLLRDLVGKQSVWEGIQQISKGDLTYKIDVTALQGETYEMARAINEMGDGLQKAVESIVKNERLKAELITNVSHDLKTPLTSIVNYVDLLKREDPQDEKIRRYVGILEQKAQRLKQLTEDLVEASRISSGNIELELVKLSFGEILEQAYGEFQDRFEERSLQTRWELEEGPIYIMADGAQLWRILENLMGNIYKYAEEGTVLRISLGLREQWACLALQNATTQEFSADADELTARFVRGDKSRSTEGSGLGLSIAQNLTQLMGGIFQVRVGDGLFEADVRFPAIQEEPKAGKRGALDGGRR